MAAMHFDRCEGVRHQVVDDGCGSRLLPVLNRFVTARTLTMCTEMKSSL